MKKFEYYFLGKSTMQKISAELKKLKKPYGSLEVYNYLGELGWQYKADLGSNQLFMKEKQSE